MSGDFHVLPTPKLKQAAKDCPLLERDGEAWIACCSRRFFPLAKRVAGDDNLAEDVLTQQVTTQGENNHGTTDSDIWVTCPYDNNGDGYCDTGGCSRISNFNVTNWMTLYELDPVSRDDLVQSMYFPNVTVMPTCTIMSCNPITSSWVWPDRYDTPTSPALVKAQAAIKVNRVRFIDRDGSCALRAMNDDGYDCR